MITCRVGEMKHRVTLQSPGAAAGYGEPPADWATYGGRWAKVEPLSGRELEIATSTTPDTTHRITVRYVEGLDATWRLLLLPAGTPMQIDGVVDTLNQHVELVIACHAAGGG
jgi:SPP1 family predicted phage head-tail adaptor